VTVAKERHELKLGKGAAFVKSRLKRLRQEDETWEADFRALPKPMMQSETHYLGMVVSKRSGSILADTQVEGRPSANDLATLLAHAMRRPLTERAHRPKRIHVRGHPQWRELFPHLDELGIKVSVRQELPKVKEAYEDHLRQMREARRAKMVRPTAEQAAVEKLFPPLPSGSGATATSRLATRRCSASSPERWTTAVWSSRMTGPIRWPRRWRRLRRD